MNKVKEDSKQTRDDIMEAAFRCFDSNGFKLSSLAMIAEEANVTRGAIYWHFKDKNDLYREVVKAVLEDADLSVRASNMPPEWDYRRKMQEIFWYAQDDSSKKIAFIYKTMNTVQQSDEFEDLKEAIQTEKINLLRYLTEETGRHILEKDLKNTHSPSDYASALFLMFEGMFLMNNISVGLQKDRGHIERYIDLIIADLI